MKAPAADGTLQVRQATPADMPQIQALFQEVFKLPISPAMLHWKYAEGRGQSWGAWEADGPLLVHCGVFFRRILAGGRPARAAQLGDLMASARKPSGLARQQSPFAGVIHTLLAAQAGPDNPDAICFGFPSERAMRLGERLGVFTQIDSVFKLSFTPHPAGWRADRCTASSLDAADATTIDRLWAAMAANLPDELVGIRDAAYLRWRYLEHPLNRYQLFIVRSRWLGRPLGAFVVRGDGAERELMDLIGPLEHLPRVLQSCREWLAHSGGQRLDLWLSSRFARRFGALADSCEPLEFRIMANPLGPAHILERFHEAWWLTGGDTDYR
ncbi:GNAT family N-acetyltransferase [Zoogloea sp. LCSB751]|uniref:GNAT family N-acetyltransferase n=1 Tax=Zoogloea sp. LCSB751 TaxID=1965277 RepID=UPI0013747D8B|nr:GNAT family N-acetyltransferase [Zoogloea sp. LCSB751]